MPRRRRNDEDRPKRRLIERRRFCKLCANPKLKVDYKDVKMVQGLITERGRIVPRRISGMCAKHQRLVTTAIKRARILALIPFTATQIRGPV